MILTYLDHDHGIWAPRPWPEHWPHSPRWRHLPRWLRWPRLPRCTHPSFASAGPGLLSKVPHIERASEHWNGCLQRRKHKQQSNWSQQNHTIQREVGVKTFCSTKIHSPISIHLFGILVAMKFLTKLPSPQVRPWTKLFWATGAIPGPETRLY